jgi:hypothetical protein
VDKVSLKEKCSEDTDGATCGVQEKEKEDEEEKDEDKKEEADSQKPSPVKRNRSACRCEWISCYFLAVRVGMEPLTDKSLSPDSSSNSYVQIAWGQGYSLTDTITQ